MKECVVDLIKLFIERSIELSIELFGNKIFIILPIVFYLAIYFVLKNRGIGQAGYFLSKKRSIYRVQRPLAYLALFFILAIFNVFAVYELACLPIDFAKGIGILAFVVLVCVVIIICVKLKKNNSFIPILICAVGDCLFVIVFNLTKDNDTQSNTNAVQDKLNAVQDKLTQNIQVFVFWVVILAAFAAYIYYFMDEYSKKYTEHVIIHDERKNEDYYVVSKIDDEYLLTCGKEDYDFVQKKDNVNKIIETKLFKIDDIRDNPTKLSMKYEYKYN
ncbi:hypothetical protein SAMN05216390_101126 [Lachnospiraceae bacterium KH1T2]|nr:hypothetical protein SAMN05216390_101126 [Lachnospiraceae bacterium KH1T2]